MHVLGNKFNLGLQDHSELGLLLTTNILRIWDLNVCLTEQSWQLSRMAGQILDMGNLPPTHFFFFATTPFGASFSSWAHDAQQLQSLGCLNSSLPIRRVPTSNGCPHFPGLARTSPWCHSKGQTQLWPCPLCDVIEMSELPLARQQSSASGTVSLCWWRQ